MDRLKTYLQSSAVYKTKGIKNAKLDQLGTDGKKELWRNNGGNQGRTMEKAEPWRNKGRKDVGNKGSKAKKKENKGK